MPRCDAHVYSGWRGHQCARNGVIERDGKFYCRQHDPVTVQQKRDDRSKAMDDRFAAMDARHKEAARIAALQVDAVAALREIAAGHNDPRALAAEVLAKHGEADHA